MQSEGLSERELGATFMETGFLGYAQDVVPEIPQTPNNTHFDFFSQSVEVEVHEQPLLSEDFSWALIELGVDEPLPPEETIAELSVTLQGPLFS